MKIKILIYLLLLVFITSCSINRNVAPYSIQKIRFKVIAKSEFIYCGEKFYCIKSDTITIACSKKIYKRAKPGKTVKFFVVKYN